MRSMSKRFTGFVFGLALIATAVGCSNDESASEKSSARIGQEVPPVQEAPEPADKLAVREGSRYAYFGDLHVHTAYSMDAFQFGTLATPDDAYRYAKGEAIKHPAGFDMQLERPLDFYAVTDHGIYLGVVRAGADTSTEISGYPAMQSIHNLNAAENLTLESVPTRNFRAWIGQFRRAMAGSEPLKAEVERVMRSSWADEIQAADRHYQPGKFTTFAAYEFSTTKPDGGSLHRNVVFRGTDNLPGMPFSRLDSLDPEDLWDWMDNLREEKGVEKSGDPAQFQQVEWTDVCSNDLGR